MTKLVYLESALLESPKCKVLSLWANMSKRFRQACQANGGLGESLVRRLVPDSNWTKTRVQIEVYL